MVPDRSGSRHPVVGVSASGVPLVNIVAPNRAGVSLNNFAHYNVGTNGAVIVNTPRSVQTQIAGWVQGNPLIGNSPARVIINQVTTGNPTRLLGMTEIAGGRANLIIANPAGITCAGCGFINIPRISLTTGRPSFNADGSLAGFDVAKGRLAVDGAGLDARGSAIDLIARAMRINGDVWADVIRTTAGSNQVSYPDGTAKVRAADAETPSVAIDVQALGGMYANSVRLIGTESGVGVRNSGVIDSLSGDIVLSAQGDVTIEAEGRLQAAGNTRIDAANVINHGTVLSAEGVRLKAGSTLKNDGIVAARSNVDLEAIDIVNRGNLYAGLSTGGGLSGPGSISMTGKNVSNDGTLAAGDNINLSGATISLDHGIVSAASAFNVNGDQSLTTLGVTASAMNATLRSKGAWINDGGMLAALHDAHVEARSASNRGGTMAGDKLTLTAGDVENAGGTLAGRLQAAISTADLSNNDGLIGTHAGALHLSTTGGLSNDRGHIVGGDGLSLDVHRLTSNVDGKIGTLSGGAGVRIAFDANNDRGTILSGQRLKLIVDGRATNRHGSIVGGDGLELQARSVDSNATGEIGTIEGRATITSYGTLNNVSGDLRSGGALTLSTRELDNTDGSIRAGEASVTTGSIGNDGGAIATMGRLSIESFGDLSNHHGLVVAGGTLEVSTRSLTNNVEGRIASVGSTDIQADRLNNERGLIGSVDGPLTATASGEIDNTRGKMLAGGDVSLTSEGFANAAGTVAGGDISLNAGNADLVNTRGVITANGRLDSESGAFDNRSGLIQAGALAKIDTHSGVFNNSTLEGAPSGGRVIATGATMIVGAFENAGGMISSSDTTRLTAQSISNDRGAILSHGPLGLESAGEISNAAGQIGGHADVTIGGATIDNTSGTMTASSQLSIDAGQDLTNADGDINAGRTIALSLGGLDNHGRIESAGNVEVAVRGDLINGGRLHAQGDLDATAKGDINNSGSMTAGAVATVSGRYVGNADTGEIAANIATHVSASQSLANAGLIDGGQTLVEVNDTATNRGRIYGDSISIGAQIVRNEPNAEGVAGAIASRGDLDVGAHVVQNRAGSLIYASNDIRTGANLNENGRASDAASDRLTNSGSIIEAGGRVDIAADRFENLNAGFKTERVTTDAGRQLWYTIAGSTDKVDPSTVYFYQRNSHEAKPGTEYRWALDDDQKFLLLPSAQYPFDEYAKYTINGIAGKIDGVHYPSLSSNLRHPHATGSEIEPVGVFRTVPAEMWAKFGIEPPPSPPDSSYIKSGEFFLNVWGDQRRLGADWYSLSVPIEQSRQPGSSLWEMQSCLTAGTERCAPFKQWYDGLTRSYAALNRAIYDYNSDVRSRTIPTWTTYDVDVKSTRDVVTATQPGIITAGREMTISARSGINDRSQIVAGGHAYLNDAIRDNSQPKGEETFDGSGKAIHTWVESGGAFRGDERRHATQKYMAPLPPRQIDLPVVIATPANRDPIKRIATDSTVGGGVSGIRVSSTAVQPIQALEGIGPDGRGEVPDRAIAASRSLTGSPTAIARAKLGTVEIRTVEPNVKLPNNALFQVVSDPGSRYLIETDRRFTNKRTWLSSETMIAALSVDPGSVQKRLGDGFYEQQLVQQQIIQATGQRLIGNYSDNQAAYRVLMANGVKAAQQFGINVGTALTDAQMAALTDDIVWLVNRSVAFPDGSEQTVLVPQVYLRSSAAEVTGTGSIIAGEHVTLRNEGTLVNSGTIASRGTMIVTADSITNVGAVAGRSVQAEAKQDLANLGGLIQGDVIDLSAGRDLSLTSMMQSATTANGSATDIDRIAHINAGALTARAGRDLLTQAAEIASSGDVLLAAQRDAKMSALRQSNSDQVRWDDKNRAEHSASMDIGTVIGSGGDVRILAGRDFGATAANVGAEGRVEIMAGRDVYLLAGERSASAYDEHEVRERGILSSKSTHTIDASGYTDAIGTLVSGNSVEVLAGNNLTANAATIAGTSDVTLEAVRDLTVSTANTASHEYHFRDVKKSGLGSAGAGISYGQNQAIDTSLDTEKGSRGSLIGSLEGNVSLRAGNKLHVSGSDLVAALNMTGVGKEVKVDASQTDRRRHETHELKSSGFTLAVKSPVIDALQNLNQQARGAGQSQDSRAAALHGIAAAGGIADLVGASGGMTRAMTEGGNPEAKIELSFGSSRSKSTYTQDSTHRNGSQVRAGGKVAFVATGEKGAGQGNVTIEGSDLLAKDVLLKATDKVNLLSSLDTERVRSTNESQSASVGVSFGTNGWGVSAAMSQADGYANSDATMQNNTHVAASNNVTIISGGDTAIVGANVSGNEVIADIGGNLNIASVQDTVHRVAQQRSMGGGFSVSQGGGSASFSMQNGHASGHYAGVNEQSGIRAGEGGFDITVKGNTDLKGAYIASEAVPERNRLMTGTLSFSDIRNGSGYAASSVGVSAGGGIGDGGNNYATHGPTTGSNAGGGLPLRVSERHGSEANTRSAISAGSITIADEANQKQDIGLLSRDVANLNGTVEKTPNLQNVLSSHSDLINAAQASAETVAKEIGAYADKKREQALTAAERESDPKVRERYWQEARNWGEGGDYRVGLHIAGGVLTGGLTGGGSGAASGAAGAGLSAKLAPHLQEIAQSIRDAGPTGNNDFDQLLGNVAANLLAGGAGAVAGGSTGALVGAATDRFNRQLSPDEREWARDRAESFAKRYEQETGGPLAVDLARDKLLGTGYRMVDAVASKGPGGDPTASAYISEYGRDMFRATPGEYIDPFFYGNKDLSLTPEQQALPGAISHPALGLGIASVLTGGLAIASVAPRVSAVASTTRMSITELSAAYKAAQARYSLATGALTGASLSAGTYTFTAAGTAAIAKFQGDDAGAAFTQRFSLLGLTAAATVGVANGIFGTSMFKWAGIPNKITNITTVPGVVIRINGAVQAQAAGHAAQAAVDSR